MTAQEFQGFFPSTRQLAFEQNWADRHGVLPEAMAQYRHATVEGYRLPEMSANFRSFCAGMEWLEANSPAVVVTLPPMNPQAGKLLTTLAKSIHTQYVQAIEAAGAKVTQ